MRPSGWEGSGGGRARLYRLWWVACYPGAEQWLRWSGRAGANVDIVPEIRPILRWAFPSWRPIFFHLVCKEKCFLIKTGCIMRPLGDSFGTKRPNRWGTWAESINKEADGGSWKGSCRAVCHPLVSVESASAVPVTIGINEAFDRLWDTRLPQPLRQQPKESSRTC